MTLKHLLLAHHSQKQKRPLFGVTFQKWFIGFYGYYFLKSTGYEMPLMVTVPLLSQGAWLFGTGTSGP